MALIKCPECGHDVSTLAQSCSNCGCPVSAMIGEQLSVQNPNRTMVEINGIQYDFTSVMPFVKDPNAKLKAIAMVREMTGAGLYDAKRIVEKLQTQSTTDVQSFVATSVANSDSKVRCPTCGSTDITKQGVMGRALSGFVFGGLSPEGRAQFRCNKCGYMW